MNYHNINSYKRNILSKYSFLCKIREGHLRLKREFFIIIFKLKRNNQGQGKKMEFKYLGEKNVT